MSTGTNATALMSLPANRPYLTTTGDILMTTFSGWEPGAGTGDLQLGNLTINDPKVGANDIQTIYLGNLQIWQR